MQRKLQKTLALLMAVILTLSIGATALAADAAAVSKARNDVAAIMLNTVKNPEVGSIGGEWAVLGLARSGYDVPSSYYEDYYKTVEAYVKDCGGVLHDKKYTEYSRVILALTAAGFDPRDVGGYDLTLALGDFDKTIWQGINGPAFALIALDSAGYDIPDNPDANTQATRDMYIDEILSRQLSDGGFALSKSDTAADPDLTGMALQALAKYQDRTDVKTATDKALACLSKMQGSNGGGFIVGGAESLESVVHVIVALCELGVGLDDSRFVKNGNSLLDRLMDYYVAGKGFEHTIGGGVNQMATEQALYALASVYRYENGLTSLYDMSDVGIIPPSEKSDDTGLSGKHADVKPMPVTVPGKTFSDIAGHKNKNEIEQLASRGIINGKSDTLFDPDATMTRAEFATIVTRGLGLAQSTSTPFADVAAGTWYLGYVGTAFNYGIIYGTSATTFNPEGQITVQEAAAMVARAAKLCGMDTAMDAAAIRNMLAQFGDYTTVDDWARESLAFCYDSGIMSQDALDIEPLRSITRCEITEMLYRMLDAAELL